MILTRASHIDEKHHERFMKALESSETIASAWKFKEAFRNFFDLKNIEEEELF